MKRDCELSGTASTAAFLVFTSVANVNIYELKYEFGLG